MYMYDVCTVLGERVQSVDVAKQVHAMFINELTTALWRFVSQVVQNLVSATCDLSAERFHSIGYKVLSVLANYRGHYDKYVSTSDPWLYVFQLMAVHNTYM